MNTREEQIELVKRLLKTGVSDDARMVLEKQFPEVVESEDERIRGWIVSLIHDGEYSKKEHAMALKAVEYLEKQKENPKSANSISSDCASNAKYKDRWHKVEDSLPDNGREVLAKDKLGNTLLARYDGKGWDVSVYDDEDYRCHNGISKWCEIPFEKQKEQKSVLVPKFKVGDVMRTKEEAEKGWKEGLPVVVSIDEEDYHCTCERIPIECQDEYEFPPMNREHKPAEWSEEDDNALEETIHSWLHEHDCKGWDKYGNIYVSMSDLRELVKSLRPQPPHWKPSEEQMLTLCCACRKVTEQEAECLDSLYNDLKELM